MPAKQHTYDTLTDALLEAIADSDLSFKAMERETGITRQSLMGFAKGERTIRLDAADTLAEYFGIQITRRKGR